MKAITVRRFTRNFAMAVVMGVLLMVSVVLAQTERIPGSYITTAEINVRKGPGTNHAIVAKIPKGVTVQVVSKEGDWLKVQSKHGNPPGYISTKYARPSNEQATGNEVPIKGTYMTTADINVRKGPGLSYEIVAKIPKDTKIQVVGAEGEWLKVQSKRGNPPGYIEKRYAQPRPGS